VGGIISEWVGGIIPESWAACSGIRIHTSADDQLFRDNVALNLRAVVDQNG
jgi:hypothetical protein